MRSTMFLSDVTVLDHAYIDNNGFIVGGSFHPCFNVSGEIDGTEQVVVDFSAIKKQIKALIDSKETGYDHKLWIIEGFSNVTDVSVISEDEIVITTPEAQLHVARSAVKKVHLIDGVNTPSYSYEYIGLHLSDYLTSNLQIEHPNVNIKVETFVTEHLHSYFPSFEENTAITYPITFRYTHGLRNSTSWGCQNIAHGHLSYIRLMTTPFVNEDSYDFESRMCSVNRLCDKIARELHDAVFIDTANLVSMDETGVQIEYQSRDRGLFAAKYSNNHKIRILPTETTIELIVEYVKEQYKEELVKNGITGIMISEGLSKGAIVYV